MVFNDLLPWKHFSIDLASPHLLLHSPSLSLGPHFPPSISLSLLTLSMPGLSCFPSVCRLVSWRLMSCEAMLTLTCSSLHSALLFQSVRLDPPLPASSINTFIQNLNPNPRRWFSKYFEVQLHNVIALLNVLMPKYRRTAGKEHKCTSCSFQLRLIHSVIYDAFAPWHIYFPFYLQNSSCINAHTVLLGELWHTWVCLRFANDVHNQHSK